VPGPKIIIQKPRKEKSKMAKPKQLAKLKEGVEAWNKWRKDNPEIRRDLTESNLTGAEN
jgi:hypothetical protein